MRIAFDPDKDAANRIKHGTSLSAASELDLNEASIVEDKRFACGEPRFLAYGPIAGRLHVLCFTMRGDVMRAIGLRKANERERLRYGQPS